MGALKDVESQSKDVYEDLPAPGGEAAGQGEGAKAPAEGKADESAQSESDSGTGLIDELATGAAAASALIGSTSGRINWKRKKS